MGQMNSAGTQNLHATLELSEPRCLGVFMEVPLYTHMID